VLLLATVTLGLSFVLFTTAEVGRLPATPSTVELPSVLLVSFRLFCPPAAAAVSSRPVGIVLVLRWARSVMFVEIFSEPRRLGAERPTLVDDDSWPAQAPSSKAKSRAGPHERAAAITMMG
jgi:hypothetical protein